MNLNKKITLYLIAVSIIGLFIVWNVLFSIFLFTQYKVPDLYPARYTTILNQKIVEENNRNLTFNLKYNQPFKYFFAKWNYYFVSGLNHIISGQKLNLNKKNLKKSFYLFEHSIKNYNKALTNADTKFKLPIKYNLQKAKNLHFLVAENFCLISYKPIFNLHLH